MKRDRDEQGRQIVQVRFYGQASSRGYTYAVDPSVGDLSLKDYVWTPGNRVNPWGTVAAVIDIGSEYAGEMSVITQKISKGYDPQTITVQRFDPKAPVAGYERPHP
jgi:hypothetical protein